MAGGLPVWLVILLAVIGGGGLAGIGGVVATIYRDKRVAGQGDRTVSITEVEKAIPGLGEIITQLRTELTRVNARNTDLVSEVFRLEQRVAELERTQR